jgi:hypothetical protein
MRYGWLLLALAACRFDPSGVGSDSGVAPHDGRATADAANDGAPPPPPDARTPAPDAMAACPTGYRAPVGSTHAYRFANTQKTWADAETDCANDGAPYTHLVVIDDDGENFTIDQIAGNKDVWIGITDEATEGTWLDITGQPVSFFRWSLGEPNNGGGNMAPPENCGEQYDGGLWNDTECTGQLRYVCECALP